MTSSAVQLPGGLKADPAALMASLQLMPSPVPNPEIKYTKVGKTTPERGLAGEVLGATLGSAALARSLDARPTLFPQGL